MDRASGYGPEGWGFELLWAHHKKPILQVFAGSAFCISDTNNVRFEKRVQVAENPGIDPYDVKFACNAICENEVIGSIEANDAFYGEIESIVVLLGYQSMGIGEYFLNEALGFFREVHIGTILRTNSIRYN